MSYDQILESLARKKNSRSTQDLEEEYQKKLVLAVQAMSHFLSSPAAALRLEDLALIRELPKKIETIKKLPGPRGIPGQSIKGDPGYTPRKGKDYRDGADGYTPKKGIDYRDGRDGDDAIANPDEIRNIARALLLSHESAIDHRLIHDSHLIGTKKIDEKGLANEMYMKFVDGAWRAAHLPKPETVKMPDFVLPQDLSHAATPEFRTVKLSGLTADRVTTTSSEKKLQSSSVTTTELGYLSGATSNIQAQIDALGGGGGTIVDKETPTGAINDINVTFTLAHSPIAGTDYVYLNGVLQRGGGSDYTLSGSTITFVTAPEATPTSFIVVSYRY